jgi:hypothetical protein
MRAPEDVLRADSLESLQQAPITIMHRGGLVTPENVSQLSVGVVGAPKHSGDGFVRSELTVQRADAIAQVLSGELCELSPGYTCTVVAEKGVFRGQAYDQRQTNIVYNHLTMGPKGWGRSGPDVSIKLDSADTVDDIAFNVREDSADSEIEVAMKKIKIRLDGVVQEIEVDDSVAAVIEASQVFLASRFDSAAKDIEALSAKLKEAEARFDGATSEEAFNLRVNKRLAVLEQAQKLAPSVKFDGMNERAVKIAALVACGQDAKRFDGKDDGYIDGAFETATPKAVEAAGVGVTMAPTTRQDSKDVQIDVAKSHAEMVKRHQNAWQTKL